MLRLPTLFVRTAKVVQRKSHGLHRRSVTRAILFLLGIGMIAYALVRLHNQVEMSDNSLRETAASFQQTSIRDRLVPR